ncbi:MULTISPECIES: YqgQ family protein [Oceanobacillus]|uniref:DUF910 family protein n=1 Tax=Oceanobacillus kimchii TaxID=746691 RepID=A0ABQ5TLV8_9BACI|nr:MULTISPECIES: YqgQ family protein [Oceanobacillus]MBT2598328.1 YqgQ family protein [Oceanobacillus sp. ISL-74]MBT2651246.1 YqgQ family protein [Oceanobacillus sp. ISL-73]MCT1575905.1 YqgQ family protein [Oceanobacillus kimchii]MCT2135542.1 YqgQ family protein [Oceanobacillus kimchii]OEH55645.1 hypothetical protein AQ616_05575 [Oceanobacillus sp. E9]
MKTMIDVRNLLKRFGAFIYTGDRLGDLELIELELDDLYQYGFITQQEFLTAKLCIKKEKNNHLKGNG